MIRSTLRLQRMLRVDLDDVLLIEQDLFGAGGWSRQMFLSELDQGHYYLIAREPDNRIAGYAGLVLLPPDEAWINTLAVRRDAQRQGIGDRLLSALLAQAQRHRIGRVLLEVAVDNQPAQRLYARHGFTQIGLRRGYYQPGNTDALVMARDE